MCGFQPVSRDHRASSDAIIVAGRDGAIKVWNRGAETIFGYAAAEVLGKSLDVIIPERLRAAHWEGFRRAIDTGRTKHGNRVLTTPLDAQEREQIVTRVPAPHDAHATATSNGGFCASGAQTHRFSWSILSLIFAHSSASGNAGFIAMIGFHIFASSTLSAVKVR